MMIQIVVDVPQTSKTPSAQGLNFISDSNIDLDASDRSSVLPNYETRNN
jgi:hypothetical protein